MESPIDILFFLRKKSLRIFYIQRFQIKLIHVHITHN